MFENINYVSLKVEKKRIEILNEETLLRKDEGAREALEGLMPRR